ncbi:MAG: hypothetical protein GC160_26645 [Acidobacteria bacterium]|nr:hypothetical protein [Acidobacteriota bacterium]
MNRRLSPPFAPSRASIGLLLLCSLVIAVPGQATTLLTNGSEIYFTRFAGDDLSVVNGADGFTIYVPPGAKSLEVEFRTAPNEPVELMVRNGLDVGIDPNSGLETYGPKRASYFTMPDNLGIARITVSNQVFPPLSPGTYYIGFLRRAENQAIEGTMKATVSGGPVEELYSLAESKFDVDAEGWTRNATLSPLPGTVVGDPKSLFEYYGERGNPGGFIAIRDVGQGPDEFFVAPDKFNVNLIENSETRIEFDLARITGGREPHFGVEVRVYSDEGSWRWIGQPPTSIPTDYNFFTGQVDPLWRLVSVPVRRDFWNKLAGTGSFEDTMANPKRIEVRGSYTFGPGTNGLDNFRILVRGEAPPQPVLPTISTFSGGFDRWLRNYPQDEELEGATLGDRDSMFLWDQEEGNPGGRITIAETGDHGGPNADAFVAPQEFLGIYTGLNQPRFEFDYRHRSFLGATDPVRIWIFGAGSIYRWDGAVPLNIWGHQTAYLRAADWTLESGAATFPEVLANVVRIEISAEHAWSRERNSLDNFAVLTADSPPLPQSLTAAPSTLDFAAVATEASPEPQMIQITSSGGELLWQAAVEGSVKDRVELSATHGTAPQEVAVSVDTAGLAAGEYAFTVVVTASGTTLPAQRIEAKLTVSPQPFPTPVISDGGVVQAATYQAKLAPGALGVIFGTSLGGPAQGLALGYTGQRGDALPTEASGVKVLVYEEFEQLIAEAPLLYVSDGQINFQMPFEVAGRARVRLVVAVGGIRSAPSPVQILASAPGIFTFEGNRAIAVNHNGQLVTATTPLTRTKNVTVYMTGQGSVAPSWASGRAASASPLIFAPAEAHAYIGGAEARITFLGLAPGMVGVLQMNIEPSYFTPLGEQTMHVNIGGFESNSTIVVVQ